MVKYLIMLYLGGLSFLFFGFQDRVIPIYFSEYGITIRVGKKMQDTMVYNKGSREDFKFVFYDNRGKCYCERYIDKKLCEKGYYENSLDTLKRYVSGRSLNGRSSPITVQKFFQPVKNGMWIIYKDGKEVKEEYLMGSLKNDK